MGYNDNQFSVFFGSGNNFMADLFNVIVYSKDNNPYMSDFNSNAEKAYFPLTYVICFFLAKIMHMEDYDDYYFGVVQSLGSIPIVIGIYIVILMLLLIMIQLYEMLDASKLLKFLVSIMIMLSGVMIFSYERGNLILLAAAGMIFFINTYDSDNKVLRECGYLSLAVAAGLKGYPAILGLLLLYRREWKAAIRLILYGLILSIGPFFMLHGEFSNIPIWFDNLKANTEMYMFITQPKLGYLYFIAYAKNATEDWQYTMYHFWKPIILGICIYGVVSNCFQSKKWLQIATLVCIALIYPENCGYYCLLYLIPVILLYINEPEKTWTDLLYLPIFFLILSPYQIINTNGDQITMRLQNIAIFVLYAFCLIQNTISMIHFIQGRLQKKNCEIEE
jgi:hypothetical protein